ncbi:GGDEF domain-containing protein [Legionella sp. 16cNR16C]|uniref:GGDEF domain-containing protein n=1 Tax=Legionella sp. 16cNR16C TaxID=2905656 RepID=UPI001E5B8B11|nr:GGDEF domain-containing protein [Legionella sp. 16cNR16C]MCE3043720.1 GGDEF domain-containing protein [Legionella sp. 16cNR16C]
MAKKVKEKLLEHLFDNTAKAITFTLILALLIIFYLSYQDIPLTQTGLWLGILCAILILRLVIAILAIKSPQRSEFFYWTLIITGFLLGAMLGLFFWSFYWEMSISQRMILLLFFAGLATGSTISMAASPLSYAAFVLPNFLPIILRFLMDSHDDSRLVAIVLIIFLSYLGVIFNANKKMLRKNIILLAHESELNSQLEQFNQKLSIVSITDELTQLANRRYFQERLIADWIRAKRASLPLTLMIIDIDYFKECNDNYGHLYGDECLKEIAKALTEVVKRQTDLAARYGGDEMVVILYNTSLNDSEQFAMRLKEAIDSLNIKNEYSPISNRLTVSIGVANTIPAIDDDYESLFTRADKALYEAKLNGRNCIAVSK